MGSAASLFPTEVLSCKDAPQDTSAFSARYDYACTGSNQVRTATTILHLILLVAVCFATFFIYLVYLRVVGRRFSFRLLALSATSSMPLKGGDMSHSMHASILTTFLRASSLEAVPLPPATNAIPGPPGWGSPGTPLADVRIRDAVSAIGSDLVGHVATLIPPTVLTRTGLRTLRSLAPILISRFQLPPSLVWPVVSVVEEAEAGVTTLKEADFTVLQHRVRRIMETMTHVATGQAMGDGAFQTHSDGGLPTASTMIVEGEERGGGDATVGTRVRADSGAMFRDAASLDRAPPASTVAGSTVASPSPAPS